MLLNHLLITESHKFTKKIPDSQERNWGYHQFSRRREGQYGGESQGSQGQNAWSLSGIEKKSQVVLFGVIYGSLVTVLFLPMEEWQWFVECRAIVMCIKSSWK